jgi:hypothetical protein
MFANRSEHIVTYASVRHAPGHFNPKPVQPTIAASPDFGRPPPLGSLVRPLRPRPRHGCRLAHLPRLQAPGKRELHPAAKGCNQKRGKALSVQPRSLRVRSRVGFEIEVPATRSRRVPSHTWGPAGHQRWCGTSDTRSSHVEGTFTSLLTADRSHRRHPRIQGPTPNAGGSVITGGT